ncbi:class I SAM-dependent methyltransferase [Nocardia sp. NPDC088792]|uniref:class I SAM-dependent methyltransferase n=1 Tax=Nocardia sp. NPDC088792 TaxID=3364332 RepID=UPI00382FDDEA
MRGEGMAGVDSVALNSAGERNCRRLLAAARCRFAEDRLADAITTGIGQIVLVGTALDTFAAHNPYRRIRVVQLSDAGIATTATAFDPREPAFVIMLGESGPRCGEYRWTSLGQAVSRLGGLTAGSQLIAAYPATEADRVARELRDTSAEVLEDLDARALACRYLDLPGVTRHSGEPRVLWARVRHTAGRPPSSLPAG